MNEASGANYDIGKFLTTGETLFADYPFKVADLSPETVAFGRKEIQRTRRAANAGADGIA